MKGDDAVVKFTQTSVVTLLFMNLLVKYKIVCAKNKVINFYTFDKQNMIALS